MAYSCFFSFIASTPPPLSLVPPWPPSLSVSPSGEAANKRKTWMRVSAGDKPSLMVTGRSQSRGKHCSYLREQCASTERFRAHVHVCVQTAAQMKRRTIDRKLADAQQILAELLCSRVKKRTNVKTTVAEHRSNIRVVDGNAFLV